MDERRITQRLLRYWELLTKDAPIPDFQWFNSATIEEIWPYCMCVSIQPDTKILTYKYEYMGNDVTKFYGKDFTYATADSRIKTNLASTLIAKMDDVVKQKKPLTDDNHMVNISGQLIKYRACLLPFGNARDGITHIVVGLTYRMF